jgi:hypothetical protein
MNLKSILNNPTPYLLVASIQTYFIYHIYTKMFQVEQMRHMMDKIYTEQLNLKSNPNFSLSRDVSTNTLLTDTDEPDVEVSKPPSPQNKDDIPPNSFFSLGNYLNKKEDK